MQTTSHPIAPSVRAGTIGRTLTFGLTVGLHGLLGVIWAVISLALIGLRDCGIDGCDGTESLGSGSDVVVWLLAGGAWTAIALFCTSSKRLRRIYWAPLLPPAWFLAALYLGTWAIAGERP